MKVRTKVIICLLVGVFGLVILIGKLFDKRERILMDDIQIADEIISETTSQESTTSTTTTTTKKVVKTTQKTTKKKQVNFGKVTTASKQEYLDYAKSYSGYNDTQMQCLDWLWEHESSWNPNDYENDACGIPQSKPCNKIYKQQGSYDWQSQIRWGINYISNRYGGKPCNAWNHYKNSKPHWY